MSSQKHEVRLARWYFGGLASAGAGMVTHPLDLIKVHLQTHQDGKISIYKVARNVIREQGVLSLYSGISAGLLRQLTYSTTRFGMYEVAKQNLKSDTFTSKVMIAAVSGAAGGVVGTPADLVNVRMQNDVKLPPEKRRNYKHALDGLIRVYKEEGFKRMFSGATTASSRAVLMTVGQLSFYDQIKLTLLKTSFFEDNMVTHFTASLTAGALATGITQPADVIKTRMMNAKPGQYKGIIDCIKDIAKKGPMGFFKGFNPSLVRLCTGTVLIFMFFEKLRLNFGKIVTEEELANKKRR